jgi:hypothetical protein
VVSTITNTTAKPKPKAVLSFLDTAKNEHIPKKKVKTAFSTKMALTKRLAKFSILILFNSLLGNVN